MTLNLYRDQIRHSLHTQLRAMTTEALIARYAENAAAASLGLSLEPEDRKSLAWDLDELRWRGRHTVPEMAREKHKQELIISQSTLPGC